MTEESVMDFVMTHLPEEWEPVPNCIKNKILFHLPSYCLEYQNIECHFYGAHVKRIQRLQNPFQFGRYLIRREMLQTNYEDIVFHVVHVDDLYTALKFNCDYRRYKKIAYEHNENYQHPLFFHSFSDLLNQAMYPLFELRVLVLKILTNEPKSQCDYYAQYVVEF